MRLLLLLAVAPGAFIVFQIYKQDTIEKEPPYLIKKLLLAGFLSVIPALIIEMVAGFLLDSILPEGGILYVLIDAFICTALTEEGVKRFFLRKITWQSPEFNYTFDAIVYAVTVSMGFAIIENIAYVFSNGIGNALLRAVTAIPGHAVFAVYMGYYYGMARLSDTYYEGRTAGRDLKMSLFVPVILHGFYDYCLMRGTGLSIITFLIFIVILFIITYINIKRYSRNDTEI